jgi:hypothetical protein
VDDAARDKDPTARERAAKREAELRQRRRQLQTRRPITAEDVRRAARRAQDARERARRAHLAAADSLDQSARRHEEVARMHQLAVEAGRGDPAVHGAAARRHREAATEDRAMAEQKRREAEAE